MIRIIDTNVILRLLLNDIPKQTEAAKKLVSKNRCKVLDISIFECVYVLKDYYKMPLEEVFENLQTVLMIPNISFDETCLLALSRHKSNPSISYADCYLVESAKQADAKLYTFDKKLISNSDKVAVLP
jgi:predicted nucleic acid-binding protein